MSPRGAGLLCALIVVTAQLAYAQQAVGGNNAPVQMPAPGGGLLPTSNLAAPQVPQGGAGQQGGGQTTTTTTTATVDPKGGNQPTADSGFGAGSIFLAILFGMALMFGLLQAYSYWVRRNY